MSYITGEQWEQYGREGYLRLGQVMEDKELAALQQRMDDIMLGKADVDYDRMLMQLDSKSGQYGELPAQTRGFKGPTLEYRKIQDLEYDSLFLSYMRQPVFEEICAKIYGENIPIAAFRAMFMNKPAGGGTLLPWHQDRWAHLDRDPLITIWTALDSATISNGCVQVIPGSHHYGLINPSHPSAFITAEQARKYAREEEAIYLELKAGESVLLHNWLLHRSDVNHTSTPRRAFSVCYMDARTAASNGEKYNTVF